MRHLSLIAALDPNGCIGKGGKLPWSYPADLRFFRSATLGHPCIMGGATYRSIGKPLPGRKSLVVTRSKVTRNPLDPVQTFSSVGDALESVSGVRAYVIGGAQIYRQTIDQADSLILTRIPEMVLGGDTFFPEVGLPVWKTTSRLEISEGLWVDFLERRRSR